MSKRTKVLTIAISLAVVTLLTIGGIALADDSRNCEKPFGPRMGRMAACSQMAGGPNGLLSEVLGLTPEEIKAALQAGKTIIEIAAEQGFTEDQLKEAMNAAMAVKLQQQVADGTITQEQADKMLQRMQEMPSCNGLPPFPRKGEMDKSRPNGLLSEILGLTPEEIKAELKDGKTIIEIAAEQGFTEDQLKEAMNAAIATKLQQQVADGTITQEQADKMLQRMQDWSTENGQPVFGFGFRGHGRFPVKDGRCAPVQ